MGKSLGNGIFCAELFTGDNFQLERAYSPMTVRFFILQCLKSNITFSALHIPGKDNNIADALSRFQVQRFRALAPDAELVGAEIPEFLWKI